jgi:3-phosphoshikimate 1-carboxyvinyltransferase
LQILGELFLFFLQNKVPLSKNREENMQISIEAPEKINVSIHLPASKSVSNRALIIHALSNGKTLPENLSDCDDTEVIVEALKQMPATIDIKAAGTAMRFMTALLSVGKGSHTLTGTERMQHRPIKVLVDALKRLGAHIKYVHEEGYPPLHIEGMQLEGGELEVPGDVSSQYVSALLMIAPVLRKGLTLKLTGEIISRPYIDLTLWMMREYGADADWSSGDTITVKPQPYRDRPYYIENDWSAASYWYEMVALSSDEEAEVRLSGLTDGSKQGDSVVKYIFSLLGVKTCFETKDNEQLQTVTLKKSGRCVPKLEYDFINSPDLAQTFVVTCCMKGVPFHFRGLGTLKIKETDRIEALKKEMRKLGFVLESVNDCELTWDGTRCEKSTEPIDTYEDHRMALAIAPASMLTEGGIRMNDPEVVSKSYPGYWEDLKKGGYKITER